MGPPRILFAVSVAQSIPLFGHLPINLAKAGWEVSLASGLYASEEMAPPISPSSLCHYEVPLRREPSFLADLFAFGKLVQLLKKLRPHIVVAATPKAALLGMVASSVVRVPIKVYFLWGLRLETTKGFRRLLLWALERLTSSCATDVLSVSSSLSEEYIRQGLSRRNKLRLLGYGSSRGVDVDRFRPPNPSEVGTLAELSKKLGLVHTLPVVGFVGRLHADKGLKTLADALACGPLANLEFQLLLVGSDEGAVGVDEMIRALPGRVVVIPEVDDVELYFRMMDIFCFPTLREGLPNVVLESLSSGVPVITTNATGARDAVADGICGLVVEKNNPYELSSGLARLITDVSFREVLAKNARPWVTERFSHSLVTNTIEAFLTDLLDARSTGHHQMKFRKW